MSRLIFSSAALIFFLGLMLLSVRAAEPATADGGTVIYPRNADPKGSTPSPVSKTSGSTGILLTALLMAATGGWLYWRARRTPGGSPVARHLAITETKALGNRQYLVVASYQDKKFLLGVCPGRIDLLTPLNDSADSS